MTFENIRAFMTYELPEMIRDNFSEAISYLSGTFGWFFILTTIILLGISRYLYVRMESTRRTIESQNRFFAELGTLKDLKEVEKKILEFPKTFGAQYAAIYKKSGKSYILLTTNLPLTKEEGQQPITLHISEKEAFERSHWGNYHVYPFFSLDKSYLLHIFSLKQIEPQKREGALSLFLSLYEEMRHEIENQADKVMAKATEDMSKIVYGAGFGKEGYLHLIIAVIIRIVNASGGAIVSYDGTERYEVGDTSTTLLKEFYIRNTTFKFRLFGTTPLQNNQIREIGSFLDKSGAFFVSLDQQNEVAKNYLFFLRKANQTLEENLPYFHNHSQKVEIVASETAKNLLSTQEEITHIELAAKLHDIGMIGDIESIVSKDSKLKKDELDVVKYHPLIGSILVEPIANIYPIASAIKYHHERYDGHGYPFGLSGSDIPKEAQILALAEYFVGIISDRSYRKGKTFEEAKAAVIQGAGKMFDPVLVDAFIDVFQHIEKKLLKVALAEKSTTQAQTNEEISVE